MKCGNCHHLFFANVEKFPRSGQSEFSLTSACDHGWKWTLDVFKDLCLTEYYALKNGNAGQYETFQETLPTAIVGTSQNVLSKRIWLDRISQQILRWKSEEHQNNSVWLYEQLPADAGLRRVFIHSMTIEDTHLPTDGCSTVIGVPITVERHYCFESPDGKQANFSTGGQPIYEVEEIWDTSYDYGANVYDPSLIGGTEPSRICDFEYRGSPFIAGSSIKHLWVGIKRDVGCGLNHWVSIWEAELGTLLNGTTFSVDSDARGDGKIVPDFTNPEMLPRVTICLSQVIDPLIPLAELEAAYEQFRGSYILLARLRPTGDNIAISVTARYGWASALQRTPTNVFAYIDNEQELNLSAWRTVELGVVHLPPDSGRICDNVDLSRFCIDIEVRRDKGIGSMDIDYIQLIPMEHHAKVEVSTTDSATVYVNLHTHEDDSTSANALTLAGVSSDIVYSINSLQIPEVDSRIVFAHNYTYGTALDVPNNHIRDGVVASARYYHRWLSLRNK